jgi:hypothetical protein
MKSRLHFLKLGLITLTSVCLSMAIGGNLAQAGETTITGRNGRTGMINTNVNRRNQSLDFDRTTTYPNGKTSNSIGTFTGDRNGNYTGDVTHTGVRGNSRNYFVEGKRTRNNSTVTNQATITGPNDNQSTFNSTRTCGNGSCTGDRLLTYPDGKTRQTNYNGQRVAPGEYSGNVNVTGRNGRIRSGNFYYKR